MCWFQEKSWKVSQETAVDEIECLILIFLTKITHFNFLQKSNKSSEYYNCLVSSRKGTQNQKLSVYPSKNIQENNTTPKPKVWVPNSHISFYSPGMHELFSTPFFSKTSTSIIIYSETSKKPQLHCATLSFCFLHTLSTS